MELARRRRELAAGFVSLAPLAHRDGRARLLLAGLAQSAAVAAARVDRLAAEDAALARLQRAAHAATAMWTARRTAAVGRMGAAGDALAQGAAALRCFRRQLQLRLQED